MNTYPCTRCNTQMDPCSCDYSKTKDLDKLVGIITELTQLRDSQETIPCPETSCICDDFDRALDILNNIRNAFREAL